MSETRAKCGVCLIKDPGFLSEVGTCSNCHEMSASSGHRYCAPCSRELKLCYICGGDLLFHREGWLQALRDKRDSLAKSSRPERMMPLIKRYERLIAGIHSEHIMNLQDLIRLM